MPHLRLLPLLSLLACAGAGPKPADSGPPAGPREAPWSPGGVASAELQGARGTQIRRAIVHLHSPWSHDACDGEPLPDGRPDAACLEDLREGLCAAQIDVAWLTDHPAHAAAQPYADRLHVDPARDTRVQVGGVDAAARWACGDGRSVLLRPGFEDELMPAGMAAPLHADPAEEERIANEYTPEAVGQMAAVGALPLIAHTEARDLDQLRALVSAGVVGVELFNLHAAFDPDIRAEHLGLSPLGWVEQLGPFTDLSSGVEPDLLVLTVLAEQEPSVARWDALQDLGRVVGTVGTDAHQNVLPSALADGERADSYRRMLRWLSQHIQVPAGEDADDPAVLQAALAAGRFAVVFEILGTPEGWDLTLEQADGSVALPGDEGGAGTLRVTCPRLAVGSPRSVEEPEITAVVFKDGAPWAEGCGAFPTDGPGAYRVRFDITPVHLRPFLGADPDPWLLRRPWVYTQHIRLR